MRSRALAVALVIAGGALVPAGCGAAVRTLSFPLPPRDRTPAGGPATTPATGPSSIPGTRTTITPTTVADPSAISEPTVAGAATTVPVVLGPGPTVLSGTVLGPGGDVVGATVQVERLVGERTVTTTAVSGAGGTWQLSGILGGRYRVRAWKAPALAMTAPLALYLDDGTRRSVTLRPRSLSGPTVTSTFTPDPSISGQPTTVDVEVTDAGVSADGTITHRPVSGRDVELLAAGRWIVIGSGRATTGSDGRAVIVASCGGGGDDPLTALVEQRFAVPLRTPRCIVRS